MWRQLARRVAFALGLVWTAAIIVIFIWVLNSGLDQDPAGFLASFVVSLGWLIGTLRLWTFVDRNYDQVGAWIVLMVFGPPLVLAGLMWALASVFDPYAAFTGPVLSFISVQLFMRLGMYRVLFRQRHLKIRDSGA